MFVNKMKYYNNNKISSSATTQNIILNITQMKIIPAETTRISLKR